MCLCHTVNHTIYIIERRGGFARRDGVRWKIRAGCYLLSGAVARACGQIHRHRARRREHAARRRMDHGMDAPRSAGDSGIPGRYGARDLSAAAAAPGAPTAVGVAGSVRALAPGLPRGPENFELVRVDRSRGRVGTHISYHICRCVALTGISHTRAGLRRKPGRDGRRNI